MSFYSLRSVFTKELKIAVINGILFGILESIAARIWLNKIFVSISIGLSMFVSFVLAGILAAIVPILIKKMGYDPAVASFCDIYHIG
ncbi:MAG: magnesium transporter [Arcobacter sp.]|nr:magnesium transporter [Arcobacter sp.]